jgi:hypothetical protein
MLVDPPNSTILPEVVFSVKAVGWGTLMVTNFEFQTASFMV